VTILLTSRGRPARTPERRADGYRPAVGRRTSGTRVTCAANQVTACHRPTRSPAPGDGRRHHRRITARRDRHRRTAVARRRMREATWCRARRACSPRRLRSTGPARHRRAASGRRRRHHGLPAVRREVGCRCSSPATGRRAADPGFGPADTDYLVRVITACPCSTTRSTRCCAASV
jgi:hypothetical protein